MTALSALEMAALLPLESVLYIHPIILDDRHQSAGTMLRGENITKGVKGWAHST